MTTRRQFLATTAAALGGARLLHAGDKREPLPVAAVVTAYRPNSHADVIVGKILDGYDQMGGPGPDLRLVSLFTDQVPGNDMSRGLTKKHGFRIAKTIEEAITLGGDKVAVAGVLSIGDDGVATASGYFLIGVEPPIDLYIHGDWSAVRR